MRAYILGQVAAQEAAACRQRDTQRDMLRALVAIQRAVHVAEDEATEIQPRCGDEGARGGPEDAEGIFTDSSDENENEDGEGPSPP